MTSLYSYQKNSVLITTSYGQLSTDNSISQLPFTNKNNRRLTIKSNCSFKDDVNTSMSKQVKLKSQGEFKIRGKSQIHIDNFNIASQQVTNPNQDEYYGAYKDFVKIDDIIRYKNVNPNIYIKLLSKGESCNLLPKTLGIFRNQEQMLLQGKLTDPKYFDMFLESLSSEPYENIKELDLSSNYLGPHQLQKLSKIIPESVETLLLTNSAFSKFHIIGINHMIQNRIINLQLQKNNIADSGLILLLDGLQQHQLLRILNISDNRIGDKYMEQFGEYVKKAQNLQELYLQYNLISGRGGVNLFKGLIKNTTLKVLDLSFNHLGESSDCTSNICRIIQRPLQELVHIDLSHNKFTQNEIIQISADLACNQIIYGFHIEGHGNYKVNSRGFLVEGDEFKVKQEIQESQKDLDFLNDFKINKFMRRSGVFEEVVQQNIIRKNGMRQIQGASIVSNKTNDICWICQGWIEIKYTYTIQKSGKIESYPIFIHFEFEDYRPTLMEDQEGYFQVYKMCPPNTLIRYFFSNPIQGIIACAKDQPMTQTLIDSQLRKFGIPIKYSDGSTFITHQLPYVNYRNTQSPQLVIDQERHYLPKVLSKPRAPEKIVQIEQNLIKVNWSIKDSFFKDFQQTSVDFYQKMMEFDLQQSKIFQYVDKKDEFKQLLLPYYPFIVQYYKFLASQSSNGQFPKIEDKGIKFLNEKIKKYISLSDWTLMLVSTQTVKDSKEKFIHDLGLVRFQFLEIIIRIAQNQQLKIDKCIEYIFNFILKIENGQDWREQRYWNQVMDLTIGQKYPLLNALFLLTQSLSFKKVLKQDKFISLIDFKNLFIISDLLESQISEQEIQQVFLYSKQLYIDELTSSDHFEMRFIEFVESLARIADIISPISPHIKDKELNQAQRQTLPLYLKFEGLLYIMFHRLKGKLNQLGFGGLEQTVVNTTVLTSSEIKKRGINIQLVDDSDSESDSEEIIRQKGKSLMNQPDIMIQKLLSQSIMPIEQFKLSPNKISVFEKRQTIKYGEPINQIKSITQADQAQKIIDQYLLDTSSPLTKIKVNQKRQKLQLFDFKIQSQMEYMYDTINE
ncbi:hypothetical protein pb186bvf_016058 [Paramecium bursaria]